MSDSATPSRPPLVGREPSYRCCSVGSRTRGTAMAPSSGSAASLASVRRDSRRRSAPLQWPGAHASCGAVVSRQTAHRRTGHGLRSSGRSSENEAARTSPRSSGSTAGRLAVLVPELQKSGSASPQLPSRETESDRFLLFDAVRTFLQRACCDRLLVLVIDDVHHAGRNSLLLLEFIARELTNWKALVILTCRDDENSTSVRQTFGELARIGVQSLPLTGVGVE